MANGVGELSWIRETRGAALDWGGIYAQGVRLTGPWEVRIRSESSDIVDLLRADRLATPPGSFRVSRSGQLFRTVEEVIVHPDQPAALVRRRVGRVDGRSDQVRLQTRFTPHLAPVLMEGIRPRSFRFETRGPTIHVSAVGNSLALDCDPLATALFLNTKGWIGGGFQGPIGGIQIDQELLVPAGGWAEARILITGGRTGTHPSGPIPGSPEDWRAAAAGAFDSWEARCPTLDIPASPVLSHGFHLARRALRTLYSAPAPGFTGLVAGYPWYAALWCRDLAWMLPAVLWMGDAEWAARSLDTVFGFQAPRPLPMLGGESGELPMQISPGPIFLYGTSDTTVYYPELVHRFFRHTGDAPRTAGWFPALERVRGWGEARLHAPTGLFRNGGEIAQLRDATSIAGRVHLGIEATDTTIWDSADRRDHAVDLQVLWLEALRSLSALSQIEGSPASWVRTGGAAASFAAALPGRYLWPEEEYLFDSVALDGTPIRRLRPNALRWVGEGLLPLDVERKLVARSLREDLTTPWGIRTLSTKDPGYDPAVYHAGQVWPIALAWAARAAFQIGDPALGGRLLERCAAQIVAERGYSNECYRGDRPEPFNSCFLLGFSIAPFLTTVFEGLWGLQPDWGHEVLRIDPRIPPGWERTTLNGVPIGNGRVDLEVVGAKVSARWSGPGALVLVGPTASLHLGPGESGTLSSPRPAQSS
jgi:hypothetical protein